VRYIPSLPLSVRLFLSFLLAMGLAALGFVAVTTALQADPLALRWFQNHSPAAMLCARQVAERYESGGVLAAEPAIQALEEATRLRLTLFDETGSVVAGRPPTPATGALARIILDDVFADHPVPLLLPASTGYPARGPSGKRYALVGPLADGVVGHVVVSILRTLVLFACAGLICLALARSVTAPILAVRQAARRFADGDLSARVGDVPPLRGRRDELRELADDFDTMAVRLEAAITAQRRLLADISHELRSPLARLNVALELARQRGGEPLSGPLDRIERETERMNTLLGELMTLSRLETALTPDAFPIVSLDDLLREVAADADFEARARGCRVEIAAITPVLVSGELELLRRALENIVRNALRYTAEGTTVELELRRDGEQAIAFVRDYGPGVPEEMLSDIFRPFYRVATDRDRATGGVGLGLAIADRAVRLHGGTIAATNHPDGGLLVTLTLPIQNGSSA
jgi:signal transduction histidine kinase